MAFSGWPRTLLIFNVPFHWRTFPLHFNMLHINPKKICQRWWLLPWDGKKKVNIDLTSTKISQKQWMKLETRSFKSNLNGALHLKCGLLHNNIIIMWDNNGISSFLAKHFRVYSIHTDAQFYSWLTWWCYLLIILCVCVHKPEIGESEANLHNACGRKRYQSQCFSKRKINCEQKE